MNPYLKSTKAYKQASVTTEDQGTLILMLYDGAIRFCKTARRKMEKNDLEAVHHNLVRAKDIIAELLASLDAAAAGEVGTNLRQLYTFIYNRLIDANVQKNMKKVEEVEILLEEVREGWRVVVGQRKDQGKSIPTNRAAAKSLNLEG